MVREGKEGRVTDGKKERKEGLQMVREGKERRVTDGKRRKGEKGYRW